LANFIDRPMPALLVTSLAVAIVIGLIVVEQFGELWSTNEKLIVTFAL